MEYCPGIQGKELLVHGTTQMNFKDIKVKQKRVNPKSLHCVKFQKGQNQPMMKGIRTPVPSEAV